MSNHELKEQLDTSSAINRTLGLVFVSFLLYVLVIVAGTSDVQLLMSNQKIELPILGVDLPLIPFYFVIPLLIIGLHLNLLINLRQHSRKLILWLRQDIGSEKPHLLHPFLYNFAIAGPRGKYVALIRFFVEIVMYALPLATLLFIQLRFTDYHSIPMTIWHFMLLLVDTFLVYYFIPLLIAPDEFEDNFDWKKQLGFYLVGLKAIIKPISYIPKVPKKIINWPQKLPDRWFTRLLSVLFFLFVTIYGSINIWLIRLICSEKIADYELAGKIIKDRMYNEVLYKPIIDVSNEVLTKTSPSQDVISNYLHEGKTQDDAWYDFAQGLVLKGRDFKFANFYNTKLFNADFEGSNLFGTVFAESNMRGANLSNTNLSNSDFGFSIMSKVSFVKSNLQYCKFGFSDLSGSDFSKANLTGINFWEDNMCDVNCIGVEMYGGSFLDVNLTRAVFRDSKMPTVSFNDVQMTGAYVKGVNLKVVSFHKTDLTGVSFETSSLVASKFTLSNLTGANFTKADLRGSSFYKVTTKGASFKNAMIDQSKGLVVTDCWIEGLDDTTSVNWEELLGDSTNIPVEACQDVYRFKYVFRITKIKNRNTVDTIYGKPSYENFLKTRLALVCDSIIPLDNLYIRYWGKDKKILEHNVLLINKAKSSCPEKLSSKLEERFENDTKR